MLINNRWRHGHKDFRMPPPLTDALKGVWGCKLQRTIFDPVVGEEVHALYLEGPQHASQFGDVEPFNMFAHTGVVRTPLGMMAFIIWVIAAGSPVEVLVEQYVNPYDSHALYLLRRQQTKLTSN